MWFQPQSYSLLERVIFLDFENKTSIEIRLIMKDLGWTSRDCLSKYGWVNGYGYSIWFERNDWHGRKAFALTGHNVCFHEHTNDLDEINHITKVCAERSLKAYEEFTDCIPFQNAKNKIAKDIMFADWDDGKVLLKKH